MPPNTDAVLRLSGRFVAAHACPLSETLALTNAHVTDLRPFDQSMPPYALVWSDALGHEGLLSPVRVYRARDLALMETNEPFARWYPVADKAPAAGDRLWTLGYEWRKQAEMYGPRPFVVSALRVVARTLVFQPPIAPGSSGACVLNARGEVVAINSGIATSEDSSAVGVAVLVAGEIFEKPGE